MTKERIGNEFVVREPGFLWCVKADGLVWAVPRAGSGLVAKPVSRVPVVKEKGYLYFLGKDGFVWRAKMVHAGRARKQVEV